MTEKFTHEIHVSINDDGDIQVGLEAEESSERLRADTTCYAIRTIKLTLKFAAAQIEDGPTIDIPDTAGSTEQIEVEAA